MTSPRAARPLGIPSHLHRSAPHACGAARMVRFAEGVYSIDEAARMSGLTREQITKGAWYARKHGRLYSLARAAKDGEPC